MTPRTTPTHRYIALLRAINVGSRTVRMERLREAFESLGHTRVETFIASGNVIFDARSADEAALAAAIERQLQALLGFEVRTFLRTPAELAAAARYPAFPPEDVDASHAVYIAFLAAPPTAARRAQLLAYRGDGVDLHVHGRDVYWLAGQRETGSSFSGAVLEKALGMPATARNLTTVTRLAAKYA